MRLLWVLLFVGASVATVTAQDSIEDFTDAELVDISEREPEPMDEPGEDGVDEDGDQSCRGDEDQKQDDDDDNDDDDDDDDGSDSHGMEKRHHRHQHHHRGHHHRHHPHHHHHRRHHHKHHRHGRHGRQGICRRQFCKCKKTAGKDCRQVIRCFMRMAFCVRKRRCHMQPHHGYRLRTLGRDKWARKGTFHPKGKPHPTRHPHPRRQECKHNFTECLNDTDRGDCKAKLKCVIQLKHCMRRGNCSHFKPHPYPTLEGPEELNDFHDDELVDVPDEDSLLEEEDEERHRNHTRRGFCRHEFRRCQNRTGDDCRKKFHCFIRMAHCVRCSHRGFKGPIRLGGFKRPEMKRPWSIGSFKRGGKFDYLTKRKGFGGMTPFGYKRKTGAGKFAGVMKWDMGRSFGKNPWIRRPPVYRPQRHHTASEKPWKMGLVYTRKAGARLFALAKKSWQTMQKYRVKPWIRRPFIYRRPHPSRRPTPTKKGKGECKQDLDECLKKAGTKDCSKKFKCYFKFLYCVRRMWHHPIQGHD